MPYQGTKHRELSESCHAIYQIVLCPTFSGPSLKLFFVNWQWIFGTSEPKSSNRRTKKYFEQSEQRRKSSKKKRNGRKFFTLSYIASLRTVIKIKHSSHSYSFVFKNKTEQSSNNEKYSQTGISVKILTNYMTVSERLRSCRGPLRLHHHGDLRSAQWSKPQKLQ